MWPASSEGLGSHHGGSHCVSGAVREQEDYERSLSTTVLYVADDSSSRHWMVNPRSAVVQSSMLLTAQNAVFHPSRCVCFVTEVQDKTRRLIICYQKHFLDLLSDAPVPATDFLRGLAAQDL